ncbi:hypothetical protein V1477_006924, partial [Vespula maculifrons]
MKFVQLTFKLSISCSIFSEICNMLENKERFSHICLFIIEKPPDDTMPPCLYLRCPLSRILYCNFMILRRNKPTMYIASYNDDDDDDDDGDDDDDDDDDDEEDNNHETTYASTNAN